jgi:HD-GYP domain-containing protein (c-di-GMP phosphodiesterase class II)
MTPQCCGVFVLARRSSGATMQQRTRTIAVLAVTQALCLAAGLWIQHQFLSALARSERDTASVAQATGGEYEVSDENRLAAHALAYLWIVGLQGGAAWLVMSRMHGEQERLQTQSQEESLLRAREVLRTRDAVIFGLAKLAESRDPDTGHHLERIALYSTRLAAAMRRHPKFRQLVTRSFVNSIGIGSALHDIGKVGVEDAVLLKPGPLTSDEYRRIQQHTVLGGECIRQIQRRVGDPMFLELSREIAMYHHEKWDGSGYPQGLAGEEIPLAARIVAIADVYDALSVRRVYKDPYPHEVCVEKIRKDAGRHFDPDLVEVFLAIQHQFHEIAARFAVFESDFLQQDRTSPAAEARNFAEMRLGPDSRVDGLELDLGAGKLSAATKSRILDVTLADLQLENTTEDSLQPIN